MFFMLWKMNARNITLNAFFYFIFRMLFVFKFGSICLLWENFGWSTQGFTRDTTFLFSNWSLLGSIYIEHNSFSEASYKSISWIRFWNFEFYCSTKKNFNTKQRSKKNLHENFNSKMSKKQTETRELYDYFWIIDFFWSIYLCFRVIQIKWEKKIVFFFASMHKLNNFSSKIQFVFPFFPWPIKRNILGLNRINKVYLWNSE